MTDHEILCNQAVVEGWLYISKACLCLLLSIVGLIIVIKVKQDRKNNKWWDTEVMALAASILVIVNIVSFPFLLEEGIAILANPDYWVSKQLK